MKITMNSGGYLRAPLRLKSTYIQWSVRDVLLAIVKARGEDHATCPSMSGQVKLKSFPGAVKFERVSGQDHPHMDLAYKTKFGNAEFCRAGLKHAFGKIPRRIYVKID